MLAIDDLHGGYGGPPILRGIGLRLQPNEVLAVLGRNGAGKSTLMRAIVGLLPSLSGAIQFNGLGIRGLPTHRIARLGIAYIPQGRGIFPRLTVLENLEAGTRAGPPGRAAVPEEVFVHFPILKQRLRQLGGTMSGGEQQMLAIARALCGRPKLLLMDEPSDGIQPNIVERLGELIPAIARSAGLAVVLVEQNLNLALATADRCLILDHGTLVHEGTPQETDRPELLQRYLAI